MMMVLVSNGYYDNTNFAALGAFCGVVAVCGVAYILWKERDEA